MNEPIFFEILDAEGNPFIVRTSSIVTVNMVSTKDQGHAIYLRLDDGTAVTIDFRHEQEKEFETDCKRIRHYLGL